MRIRGGPKSWSKRLESIVHITVAVLTVTMFAYSAGVRVDLERLNAVTQVAQIGSALPTETTGLTPESESQSRWYEPITTQVRHVWSVVGETWYLVRTGAVFQLAQVGTSVPEGEAAAAALRPPGSWPLQPATDPSAGTLIVNTPLLVDNTLTVIGTSSLATTTLGGPLGALDASFTNVSIDGTLTIDTLTAAAVTAGTVGATAIDTATLGATTVETADLGVLNLATIAELIVDSAASLGSLQVLGASEVTTLLATGVLTAQGGMVTQGADIDAGEGEIFASNIVNEIVAGENVTITGTQNVPIISVSADDLVGVLSLNGQSGDLDLVGGVDITISGLTISSNATLATVRSRGGCVDCITDGDVRADLTISGGTINGTPIGLTTPSSAAFTTVAVGTTTSSTTLTVGGGLEVSERILMTGSATSTFFGSVNLESGCFAIGGVCIEGVEPSSYVGLNDTPAGLTNNALQFANASGTALTQSANLVFADGRLGVGTATPERTLTVVGDTLLSGALRVESSTSSQFVGGINVTGGCVSVDGVCLVGGVNRLADLTDVTVVATSTGDILLFDGSDWTNVPTSSLGLGDGRFRGLSDTPDLFTPSAISFVNAGGSALTQDSEFIYSGGQLGVGTSDLRTTLTVGGDISVLGAEALRWYDSDSTHYVGFRAPSTLTGSTVWTLPASDGSANQLLVTDGAGNLFFDDLSALGGGANRYVELTDTPGAFVGAGVIPFVNATSSALTQASTFVFREGRLGVGVNDPGQTLTVQGDIRFQPNAQDIGMVYSTSGNRFGFGTPSISDNRIALRGSLTQFGGVQGDPYELVPRGSVTTLPARVNDIVVVGNLAYAVTDSANNDFHIIDVTNPDNPVEIGQLDLPLNANGRAVTILGQYAYVVSTSQGDDFHVINVSDPTDPEIVNSLPLPTILPTSVNDVAIKGNYAYVVANRTTDAADRQFFVIDITDPTQPSFVNELFLADSGTGIDIAGNFAYITSAGSGDDLQVFDISDPVNPVLLDGINLPTQANDVVVRGRYAYVVTNSAGNDFHVIDILDPFAMDEVGSLPLPTSATALVVNGRYAYVTTEAAGQDIHVIDIFDPSQPRLIGGFDLQSGDGLAIAVSGRYAYVGGSGTNNRFRIFDVSGAELQSAVVHSLLGGSLDVSSNVVVAGRVSAGLGVSAGVEGLRTDGQLIVQGTGDSFLAGRLGIGTSTPSSELTVAGTIRSTSIAGCDGLDTDMFGNIICYSPSDERLKTGVQNIEGALDSVLQLQGVSFYWLDEERFGPQRELGFIAQEVAEIFPEAVREREEYWSLNPARLVAVVVEAIKELWEVVRGNQDKLAELETRVAELEAQQSAAISNTPGTEGGTTIVGENLSTTVEDEEPETATTTATTSEMSAATLVEDGVDTATSSTAASTDVTDTDESVESPSSATTTSATLPENGIEAVPTPEVESDTDQGNEDSAIADELTEDEE